MQRKFITLIICLLLCWTGAFAQQKGKVSGTVKDASSNESLVGVSVYVERLQVGVTTDAKGRFELELPKGEHVLHVSYVGFRAEDKKVTVKVSSPVS